MGKLIDAEKLKARIDEEECRRIEEPAWYDGLDTCREIIEKIPAVDAAPVVHGRWIEYPLCLGYVGAYSEDHIVCSNCKSVWSIIDNDTERFKHCPYCGAKMDGEADER